MKRAWSMTAMALAMMVVALGAGAQNAGSGAVDEKAARAAFSKLSREVGPAHRQLEYFVGRWNTRLSHGDAPADAGFAEFTLEMGGRHLRQHFVSRMGNTTRYEGVGYFGYDNRSKLYYHHWMEDYFSAPFLFIGSYDAAKKRYALKGELGLPYQSYKPYESEKATEVIRVIDQDNFALEWHMDGNEDGPPAMKVEYTRAK